MVWIHGGGFINGAGSQYTGTTLAKKGHVIVVTINYRLGVFGFLATPNLAAEPGNTSGNYGILDQQKALSWLKSNIANFGGNPNNINIFGGSAGAVSVASHIASPTSAGLFQRAIMESPLPGYVTATKDQNYAAGASIVGALGCTDAEAVLENACLRAASVDDLNNITPTIYMAQGLPTLPKVTIDGVTLETSIDWAIASGDFNQVPVLMGANEKEGAFLWAQTGITLDADSYVATVNAVYGALGPLVLATYPFPDPAYSDANDAFAALMGDSVVACPTRTLTRQLTTAGVPVYAYHFVDPTPPPDFPGVTGPTHGSEVIYVFQDSVPGVEPAQLTTAQKKLSDKMISYWTKFARFGHPNGA
jgi:para-nitrobenzyl esterase